MNGAKRGNAPALRLQPLGPFSSLGFFFLDNLRSTITFSFPQYTAVYRVSFDISRV